MLSFVRRHRRHLAAVGVAAGALALSVKVMEVSLCRWRERHHHRALERTKKCHHFESTESTAMATLRSLFPALSHQVDDYFDTQGLVRSLQSCSGQQKVQMFRHLVTQSVGACATYVYTGVVLALLIKTQMSVLGGRLYRETVDFALAGGGSCRSALSQPVQEAFLSLAQKFISTGVREIALAVHRVVKESDFEKMSLKTKVSVLDICRVLRTTLLSTSCGLLKDPSKSLTQLCGELDLKDLTTYKERLCLEYLVDAASDILEQRDTITVAQSLCLSGISNVEEELAKAMGDVPTIPLAKVPPVLEQVFVGKPTEEETNGFFRMVLSSRELRQFSANVYEAFASDACAGEETWMLTSGEDKTEDFSAQKLVNGFLGRFC